MKTLIVTIIAAILTISLTGCTFVREFHHARRPHHEVIVTRPWRPPVRHHRYPAPRHFPERHYPGPGRRHH
jgi:hypothetical protein